MSNVKILLSGFAIMDTLTEDEASNNLILVERLNQAWLAYTTRPTYQDYDAMFRCMKAILVSSFGSVKELLAFQRKNKALTGTGWIFLRYLVQYLYLSSKFKNDQIGINRLAPTRARLLSFASTKSFYLQDYTVIGDDVQIDGRPATDEDELYEELGAIGATISFTEDFLTPLWADKELTEIVVRLLFVGEIEPVM